MENFNKRFEINEEDREIIDAIEGLINRYEMANNLDIAVTPPEIYNAVNLSIEELSEMTGEQILHTAYLITGHVSKLRSELNRQTAILNNVTWPFEDGMGYYLAPGKMKFPEYTSNLSKEQLICEQVPLLKKLRQLKRKVETVVRLFDGKIAPLEKQIELLYSIGRKR